MIQTLKEKYWYLYYNYYLPYIPIIETNSSISKTILVVGSARSGTTWLGSVCANILNARPIFEPFILTPNKEFYFNLSFFRRYWSRKSHKKLLMNYSLYISHLRDISSTVYKQIKNILRGRVRSQWTDREISFDKVYSLRVIKEVRANLMLYFLAKEWPELKIIWIVRNPLKVIQSQLYLSCRYKWSFDLDNRMLDQKSLTQEWLLPFMDKIKKSKTLPERLMHRWCVENFVPLNQKIYELPNVLFVSYDKLISSLDEWNKIGNFIGNNIWDIDKLQQYIERPSHTSMKRSSNELNVILEKNEYCEAQLIDICKQYNLCQFLNNDI